MSLLELFQSQLLGGSEFLTTYREALDALYADEGFMKLVDEIKQKAPQEESETNIEAIKTTAKMMIFESKAAFQYPSLKEIMDKCAEGGFAKNSAFISVYLSMRIYKLLEEQKAAEQSEKPCRMSDLDYRQKWPAEYRCDDGHYVRSKNEMLVDNWLYNQKICHAYEKALYFGTHKLYSDFYLPEKDLYIEIWGLTDPEYEKRRQQKIRMYKEYKYNLMEMDEDQIRVMDDVLSAKLLSAPK